MYSSRIFAVLIWKNDDPITGSVLNVNQILEPRKSFDEYTVGEEVKARCPGYGTDVHQAIIGMIRPIGQKKQLEEVLKGNKFLQLVEKHVKGDKPTSTDTTTVSSNNTQDDLQEKQDSSSKTSKKAPTTQKKRKISTKKTDTEAEKESSTAKKKQKTLEMVAQELELTQLQQQLREESDLPSSQIFRESMDVILDSPESTPRLTDNHVCIDCIILQQQVTGNSQEISSLQTQLQSSKSEIQYLQTCLQTTQQQLGNLQYYVQCLWNKHQGQLSTGLNSQTVVSPAVNHQSFQRSDNEVQQTATEDHVNTPATGQSLPMVTNTTPVPQSVINTQTSDAQANVNVTPAGTPTFFNNYTKEILEAKVLKIKDYSKCAKTLLRILYTDEERQGRSLLGIAANTKYAVKPALEHPERLQVIFDIVGKRWPSISLKDIKGKLAEALKPSVCKQL